MSSIDDADSKARALFETEICSLAADLKQRGKQLLAPGPDPSATSYFEAPPRPKMSKADFELPALDSPEAFVEALAAIWERDGLSELSSIAAPLTRVAQLYAAETTDEADSVNPFVYTMF